MINAKCFLKLSNNEDNEEFIKWSKQDSIFDLTCRPISCDLKRISPDNRVVRLSFFIEGVCNSIGRFSYFDINSRNNTAEFGYSLNPEYRGKGLGKQMIQKAFDYVFTNTNLNKLSCQTASFNKPSVKLLESLSLHLDGSLREHHERNGELFDDLIFSILRSEWTVNK